MKYLVFLKKGDLDKGKAFGRGSSSKPKVEALCEWICILCSLSFLRILDVLFVNYVLMDSFLVSLYAYSFMM